MLHVHVFFYSWTALIRLNRQISFIWYRTIFDIHVQVKGIAGPFWIVRKITARTHDFLADIRRTNSFSGPIVCWNYVVNTCIRFLTFFKNFSTMTYLFSTQYRSPDDNLDISIFTWYNFIFNFEIWLLREIPYIISGGCCRKY